HPRRSIGSAIRDRSDPGCSTRKSWHVLALCEYFATGLGCLGERLAQRSRRGLNSSASFRVSPWKGHPPQKFVVAPAPPATTPPSPAVNPRRLICNPQGSKLTRRKLNFSTRRCFHLRKFTDGAPHNDIAPADGWEGTPAAR